MVLVARALLTLLALLPGLDAVAQTKVDAPYAQEAQDAKALLQKAVSYYQAHGDEAFAVFSRQGEFIKGQLYVYVVDTNGVMLASGYQPVPAGKRKKLAIVEAEASVVRVITGARRAAW